MRILSCAGLALPLLFVFATAARTADKAPETPYFPLKVGDSWDYRMGDTKFTLKVAKFEEVDKQNCARVEMTVGGKVHSYDLIAVKADGVYRYVTDGNKADPPVCFLKLPSKKGETWKVESSVAGMGKLTGTFKSGEVDELKVGDKKYEKLITVTGDDLVAGGQKISVTYYFAKDVGMVKQTLSVNGQQAVIELEKFEPGK
jgi:hypothetical protein